MGDGKSHYGPVTLLSDTFVGGTGTLLTAHAMDVGGGWSNVSGTMKLSGNKATGNSGVPNVVTAEAGQANVTVSVDYTVDPSQNDTRAGIAFRVTDVNNHWRAVDSGGSRWSLEEVIAGAPTRGTTSNATINAGQTYHLSVAAVGDSITFSVDGVTVATYSATSTMSGNTKHGIYAFKPGSPTQSSYDNFLVTKP